MRVLFLIASLLLTQCVPKASVQENVVNSFVDANIPHLDPIHSTLTVTSTVNAAIFEGLYHYHYLKRPITVEPKLATSMPKISDDGKTYTIKIKKGVLFHDDKAFPQGLGRELVARDFIYSWKRMADPKNKASAWWIFDGIIEGLNDWRDDMRTGKATYDTPVSGLTTKDPHTLVVKLNRTSYQFLHFLAIPATSVVAREVVDTYGPEIINHPIGTGPFILKKWTRNSEIVLEKNKKYRKEFYPVEGTTESKEKGHLNSAGLPLPLADKVVIKVLREIQPEWLAFLKGQIDHGRIPTENDKQVLIDGNELRQEYKDKGIRIHSQHRLDATYIGINMEDPILGENKHLRKALHLALDKTTIIKRFYSGRGVMAQSPIPPKIDSYDPNYRHPLQYNLEEAKKHMQLAGYPEGKGLPVIDYELGNVGPWSRRFGEFVKDQWLKIGVRVRLVANTWPQFNKKLKERKAQIFNMSWTADYPDSQNFFQMFYSKNVSPGSNSFNFINREYDQIYERTLLLPPGKERNTLSRQLIEIVNKEIPAIFVVHRLFKIPFHNWLENYHESPMIHDFHQYLKVNTTKKKHLIKAL